MTIEKQLRSCVSILRLATLVFAMAEVVTGFFERPALLNLVIELAPWVVGSLISLGCRRYNRFAILSAAGYVILARVSVVAAHILRIGGPGYSVAVFGSICLVLSVIVAGGAIEYLKSEVDSGSASEPMGLQTLTNE